MNDPACLVLAHPRVELVAAARCDEGEKQDCGAEAEFQEQSRSVVALRASLARAMGEGDDVKEERPTFLFEDDDKNRLHVTWSRSGKTLILSVFSPQWNVESQVSMAHEDIGRLTAFIKESRPD